MRFMRGVVDSEDIPLNLSREHLQDSALVSKLSNVITKKILKFLDEESQRDPGMFYVETWINFSKKNIKHSGMNLEILSEREFSVKLRIEKM
jgi:TNF receptor-associated protein 1